MINEIDDDYDDDEEKMNYSFVHILTSANVCLQRFIFCYAYGRNSELL